MQSTAPDSTNTSGFAERVHFECMRGKTTGIDNHTGSFAILRIYIASLTGVQQSWLTPMHVVRITFSKQTHSFVMHLYQCDHIFKGVK